MLRGRLTGVGTYPSDSYVIQRASLGKANQTTPRPMVMITRYGSAGPCLDCGNGVWDDWGVDPRELPEQHKFTGYVLEDSVWEETGLRRAGNPMFGVPPQILCIECAQVRIGRELTLGDFKDLAMNFQSNGAIDLLFPDQNDRRERADEEIRLSWEAIEKGEEE